MNNIDYMTLIICFGLAVVLYAMPFTRRHIMAPYSTVIHEYGHAVANLMTFGLPTGIKVYWNQGGGVTHHLRGRGLFSWFGGIISGLSGYPAPIVVGWMMIVSVPAGYSEKMSYALAFICFIMLFLMRNFFGLMIGLLTFLYMVLTIMTVDLQDQLMTFGGMFILIMGVADFIYLMKVYFTGNPLSDESDLGLLKESYFFPKFIWLILIIAEIVGLIWIINIFSFNS